MVATTAPAPITIAYTGEAYTEAATAHPAALTATGQGGKHFLTTPP